jgi:hypothetical protein
LLVILVCKSTPSLNLVLVAGVRLCVVLRALWCRYSPLHCWLELSQGQLVDVARLILSALSRLVMTGCAILLLTGVNWLAVALIDNLVSVDHVHASVLVVRRKTHKFVNLIVGGCNAVGVDRVENVGDVLRWRCLAVLLLHALLLLIR